MNAREYVENVLAPRLQGDGGWGEVQKEEEGTLELVFRGECSKCLILDRCTAWMEQKLAAETGRQVRIRAIRKKPYFWDAK